MPSTCLIIITDLGRGQKWKEKGLKRKERKNKRENEKEGKLQKRKIFPLVVIGNAKRMGSDYFFDMESFLQNPKSKKGDI